MIKGKCETAIDKFRNRAWPIEFAAVPRKGEYVQAVAGYDTLEVLYVTHCAERNANGTDPYIKVQLGRQYASVD